MAATMGRSEVEIRVAGIQMEPIVGEKDHNIRHSIDLIETTAGNGANLIVQLHLARRGQSPPGKPGRLSAQHCHSTWRWE